MGNTYTLADVTYVTVQLTHEITGASKYEAATVTAGSATVNFTRIPSGTWKIKANLYENSTATAEMLYWVYDKILVKSKQDTTAALTAIPSGGLTNLTVAEAVLPTDITLNHEPVMGLAGTAPTLQIPQSVSLQLTSTMVPPTASFQKVSWSSSNPAVASVDNFGRVYTYKTGTVVITAQEAYQTGVTSSVPYSITVVPGFIGDWTMNMMSTPGTTTAPVTLINGSTSSNRGFNDSKMYWRIFNDGSWEYYMHGGNSPDKPMKGTWIVSSSGKLVFTPTQKLDGSTGGWIATTDTPLVTPWSLQDRGTLKLDSLTDYSSTGTMERFSYKAATSIVGVKNTLNNGVDFADGATRTLDYKDINNFQLKAESDYDASVPGVLWGSSNLSVASFDSSQNLSILKVGTTTLRATSLDGKVTATMSLNVTASAIDVPAPTNAWVNFNFNTPDPTKASVNLQWMGTASKFKVESSVDNATWVTETGVTSTAAIGTGTWAKPFGQKIYFRISSLYQLSIPANPTDNFNFDFEGVSKTVEVYVPETNSTHTIFTPWIVTANLADPPGSLTHSSTLLGINADAAFYTDSTGTTQATTVLLMRYGLDTYRVYGSATTLAGVIVKYDLDGAVTGEYPLTFGAYPKLWDIVKDPETGIFTFKSYAEAVTRTFSGGSF